MRMFSQDKINFMKFVEFLLPPSLDLEGCEILFPDSLFFDDSGKAAFVAKTDKEGKMLCMNQPNKMGLNDIRQKFSALVRDRKADTKDIKQWLAEKEKA